MRFTRTLRTLGVDGRIILTNVRGIPAYWRNRREFLRQHAANPDWDLGRARPCLADRYDESGVATGQYFHQDLWVAQQVFSARPRLHVDVGSRIDGFVAHVAAFMPVEVFDIRPLATTANNVKFVQRDMMSADPTFDGYAESVSCLHALEHFGLGRYGDPIDYLGYRKGWSNIARMVAPGGNMYLSLPISRWPRIEFDAHRLFGVPQILDLIGHEFTVGRAALVDDRGDLREDVDPESAEAVDSFNIEYGCLMMTLRKNDPGSSGHADY